MPDLRLTTTPKVAIVGRPNVGKSTLFNRLLGERKAITSAMPGTTTDANYGSLQWNGLPFTAIDTAGLDLTADNATDASLLKQANLAMAKADMIIFVVEGAGAGLLPGDRSLAKHLQKAGKPVVLAMSKADNPGIRGQAHDPAWQKLGLGTPMAFSGTNGSGVGDLLDEVVVTLKKNGLTGEEVPAADLRVAIIGRPNVGKSSLLNALAGEERVIVSDIPHTTKEPQDSLLTYATPDGDKRFLLIDTVGIRKKSKVGPGLEKLGVHLSLAALESADVVLLIIDAEAGIGLQEKKLADLVRNTSAGLLIVINKWDIAREKELGGVEEYKAMVRSELPFLDWADIVFLSAKTRRGVDRVLDHSLAISRNRAMELSQETLDLFMEKLKRIHNASHKGENRPKLYGMTQIGTLPPKFMVVAKDKDMLHPNFLHFIEQRMRDDFGFAGTSLKVVGREISKGKNGDN